MDLRAASKRFMRFFSTSEASLAFLVCLMVFTFLYRIQLTIRLFSSPVRPFDFNPALEPAWFMVAYWPYDLLLITGCFLISWLASRMRFAFKQEGSILILKITGIVFLHVLLVGLLLVYGIHGRLLFDVQTGLDCAAIVEGFSNIPIAQIVKVIEIKDFLLILLPIGLFWLVFLSPRGPRVWIARISAVLILFLSVASVIAANGRHGKVPAEIRLNPTLFLLSDVAENAVFKHPTGARNVTEMLEREYRVQPTGQPSVSPLQPLKFLPSSEGIKWNIVFFVMESVGTRYTFDTTNGHRMPMPFLYKLSKEGWYLKKHYTTSNVSTKAMFSLLSGLYDFFKRETFGTLREARVPSLYNFLPEGYDSFLVTPSSSAWYFPSAFLTNSGLPEAHTYENLNFKTHEEFHSSLGRYIARDEIETVDYFNQRLREAREPFMGIYISFTAHFPYFDYGPDYQILENDGRLISRYYNNLNLLDRMIKRVYDNLHERGLLERTIFVIVGDHGQAFGQHQPDNFMHYRYSYSENLETPVILYQPALFRPRVFEVPTSHVDLLPTLLDVLRVPYNPALFDGESLLRNKSKRNAIFFYGYEGSISMLDQNQIKVQYSLKKKRGWAFDLRADPDERNPLDGSLYDQQLEALQKFAHEHDISLLAYNSRFRERKGQKPAQPSL